MYHLALAVETKSTPLVAPVLLPTCHEFNVLVE